MQLCIFEDQYYSGFLPLAYFRPVYSLRCGATKLREKIARVFPKSTVAYHLRPELAEHFLEMHPERPVNALVNEPTWFVNGRVLADETFRNIVRTTPKNNVVYVKEGEVVAAYVVKGSLQTIRSSIGNGVITKELFRGFAGEEVEATLLRYPWELVHRNTEELGVDFARLIKNKKAKTILRKIHPGVYLVNKKNIMIGKGSVLKPGVVLDAEQGPIMIGENVILYPNAVVEGPAFIGDGSIIKAGAKIYGGTTIGEMCKVGGEVDTSIIHSYSNKQHDGFLGHSYLSSWVNIGAGTNTSDLKNNYGTVEVMLNGERVNSGLQFVGLFMGDHSKTGINVMFDTGTVVGVSCNVYGAGLPPKYLPSFSWGNIASSFSAYKLEKGVETAQRVMARRNVQWTPAYERLFRSVFEATTADRARGRIF